MADVFVSYSRDDAERASQLVAALRGRRLDVWWDDRIPAGQRFEDEILGVLEKASSVVVLWSPSSVASDWVRREAKRGRDRGALIPVRIDDVDLPGGFEDLHTLDFRTWAGDSGASAFGKLMTAIESNRDPEIARKVNLWIAALAVSDRRPEGVAELYAIGAPAEPATDDLQAIVLDEVEEPAIRSKAAAAIGNIGELAARAVPALAAVLESPESDVRSAAVGALTRMGALPRSAVAATLSVLEDRDENVATRALAATALGSVVAADDTIIRALAGALRDNPDEIREASARALGRIGPAASDALAIAVREAGSAKYAARVLGGFGPKAIDALIPALADRRTCGPAAHALGTMGADAASAVTALIDVIDCEFDTAFGGPITQALGSIGEPAVEPLLRYLQQAHPARKRLGAIAFGHMGASGVAGAPALLQLMRDGDSLLRNDTCRALKWMGPGVVAPCVAALADEHPGVRSGAAQALGLLSESARDAVEPLIEHALDAGEEHDVRTSAVAALGRIGSDAYAAVGSLTTLLNDERLRPGACDALDSIGAASLATLAAAVRVLGWSDETRIGLAATARKAVAARRAAARDARESGEAREKAASAVAGISRQASLDIGALALARRDESMSKATFERQAWMMEIIGEAAAPAFEEALMRGNPKARRDAITGLGNLGVAEERSASLLVGMLADREDDVDIRTAAARALARISPSDVDATEVLRVRMLDDEEERSVRESCAIALGRGGARCLPFLTRVLEDSEQDIAVREAAAVGIAHMGRAGFAPLQRLYCDPEACGLELRIRLGRALKSAGTPAVPVLVAALGSAKGEVVDNAAWALAEMGKAASEAEPTLLELIRREPTRSTIHALGAVGSRGADTEAALAALLGDPTLGLEVRLAAATSLGTLGCDAPPAIAALTATLVDTTEDPDLRRAAIRGLTIASKPVADAVEPLLTLVEDPDWKESGVYYGQAPGRAAFALGSLARERKDVLGRLDEILADPTRPEEIRRRAAQALGRAGSAAGLFAESLERATLDDSRLVRKESIRALGENSLEALQAITQDRARANDERIAAVERMAQLGPGARAALEDLTAILEDSEDDEDMRLATAWAIGQIAPRDPTIVAKLRDVLSASRTTDDLRYSTILSLDELGAGDFDTRHAIGRLLRRDDCTMKLRALVATVLLR